MANTIQLRRSATPSAVPTTSQLALGELAINTYDGKLYLKKNVSGTETIVDVTASSGGSGSGDVVGPTGATADALARFNSTTGKLIKNSTAILSDAGNLSLGGATETVKLNVSGSQSIVGTPELQGIGASARTAMYINSDNINNPAGPVYGTTSSTSVSSSTSGLYATGTGGLFKVIGSGSATGSGLTLLGFRTTVGRNGTSDTATDAYLTGAFIDLDASSNASTGFTSAVTGVQIVGNISSGTVNNWYGLFIQSVTSTGGTINANWGVYQQQATATNFFAGKIGINTAAPGSELDVKGTIRLSGSTSGYVGFSPAAAAGSTIYTLPSADGSANQVLQTNGSAVLSWASGGLSQAAALKLVSLRL